MSDALVDRAPPMRRLGIGLLRAQLAQIGEAERDQFPLWLPIGLMIGIASWFTIPERDGWIAFLLGSGAAAASGFAMPETSRWGRALGLFALAACLGCGLVWMRAQQVAAPRLDRPQLMTFTGRIESVQALPSGEGERLLVVPSGAGLPVRLRLNVPSDKAAPGLVPGATIRARAWMMPPAPMAAPGAYDFARAAWFQRIGGSGRALDLAVLAPPADRGWNAGLAALRQRLSAHIRSRLGGGEGAIAAALATGDQGAIPTGDADAMRRAGLTHLLSVSGLHLTAVVGAVMLLTLKLLALSPALALRFRLVAISAGAGAIAGVAYTLLTGAEVPTIRSCVAALLILAGIALGREALTLRLLAVGALIVLLLWPESLVGASFQLSFAAIASIVALHENPRIQALLARRDEGPILRLGRFLFGLVLTGLVVETALSPIALFHFHRTGLYGAGANVIAIPLTTFIIMPLEALALLFDAIGLGAPFWWLAGKALSLLLWLAHTTANLPGAVAMLPSIPRSAFALIVTGGLWICLWRTRWRAFGLVAIAAGTIWAVATPAPDLIVTGDGRHLVLRDDAGRLALLRPRAGDYVRDLLAELSGAEPDYYDLGTLPDAACSSDLCVADLTRAGRRWRILATRSGYRVPWAEMARACASADIVVADRRLPRGCTPRWLKADAALLRRTRGLAITLGTTPRVATVAAAEGAHPWVGSR